MPADDTPESPRFSLVLPACNEAPNLADMHRAVCAAGEGLPGAFEVVWVNDGSTDGTGDLLEQLAAADARVRVVHLSRNFGHMAALTAGLEAATGTDAVVTLDSDGQHPPALIAEMVARWSAGADIVQAIRRTTEGEGLAKRLTSRAFYAVMNRLSDVAIPEGAADFRLLSREAVDALNSLPERERFVRGLVHWIGFRVEQIEYTAPPRAGGATKYSLWRMCMFAIARITSFSIRPLRMVFVLGLGVLAVAFVYAVYVLWCWLSGRYLVPGWTSLLLVTLFLGGTQLLTLGVVSEYVGRLYEEAKRRPVYIARKRPPAGPK